MPKKINSREKGKRGELELAALAKTHGYKYARRGQQYSGGNDSADVVGVPGVHFEAKWTERFDLYSALDQAVRDSTGSGNVPVVAHKRNRHDVVIVMRADDWFELYKLAEVMR